MAVERKGGKPGGARRWSGGEREKGKKGRGGGEEHSDTGPSAQQLQQEVHLQKTKIVSMLGDPLITDNCLFGPKAGPHRPTTSVKRSSFCNKPSMGILTV